MTETTSKFPKNPNDIRTSSIGFISSEKLPSIVKEFNQKINSNIQRSSILKKINFLGISLFTHRILAMDELRLVQRNGVPELAAHSGSYQRRKKIWSLWKPWTWFRAFRDNSSTIGIYKLSRINEKGYIGYGDRHLVIVNQGEYAKVIIDGEAVFLDEGVHIIKTNNFSYLEKFLQSANAIQHKNLCRLLIPSGKIAAILVDNQPYLLNAGEHYIRSSNMFLSKKSNDEIFYNNTDPIIQCGSLLRLLPEANTIAVYYQDGKQKIFPEPTAEKSNADKRELIIQDGNIKFSTFLSTNLNNRHYPSKSSTAQFEFYTRDSIKVGVRLFVAYRITDPTLALQILNPKEIDNLIEYVTHVDMAVAGQKTSLQGIQTSDNLKGNASGHRDDDNPSAPPLYDQVFISAWQDRVKTELTTHLQEYGIELVRLNIEEIKILDPEKEKKISAQSYRVAEASAKLAAVDMERQVAEQGALTEANVAKIKAENQTQIAELEKQALITVAEGQAQGLRLKGEALSNNAQLFQLELAKQIATAIQPTDKIISPESISNLLRNSLFSGASNTIPSQSLQTLPSDNKSPTASV